MLKLIMGRTGSGKTTLIHREIMEFINKKIARPLILLVPEQYTLQAERELLTGNNLDGLLRLEVLSFQRLAYKVLNEVGGSRQNDINDLGKVMVLRKIFNNSRDQLKVFQRAAGKAGFLKEFNHLMTEFKKNKVDPEAIREQLAGLDREPLLQNKLEDIALIYNTYNRFMEGRYEDQEDRFDLLIEAIPRSQYLQNAVVWVDGFHGFTVQEYAIIEKLLLKTARVTVTLTYEEGENKEMVGSLYKPTIKTYQRLERIALQSGVEKKELFLQKAADKPAVLLHLEEQLFSYPYEKNKLAETNNLSLFAGSNYYSEVEHTAARMVALAREKGYRWREMAVITGDIGRYALQIKRVFPEYGIPYFLDEKKGIMNNPTVRCLLSGLRIVLRNFRYEDTFNYLKSGFSTLTREEYELLENFALEYGIEGRRWLGEFEIESDHYDLPLINRLREELLKPLLRLGKGLKSASKVRDYNAALFTFLQEIKLEEKLADWITRLREEGRLAAVRENTQIWNIILEVLGQLEEIMGEEMLSLEEYHQVLEAGLGEYELAIIPPTVDQVFVGNLERSRSHRTKALFILGINDGVLPRSGVKDGVLLDDEKLLLKSQGLEISSDSITGIEEERFRIYTVVAKPEEYLWLSYALADMEGSSLRPSVLFKRIEEIFPDLKTRSDLQERDNTELVATPEATFKYLVENMRYFREGKSVQESWWDVYGWYFTKQAWRAEIKGIIEGLFYNNQQDYLEGDRANHLYQKPLKTSISRLEEFSSCPFAHFIDYGLRPAKRKIYEINPVDIGQIFHNAVEAFARKIREEGLIWSELTGTQRVLMIREAIQEIAPDYGNSILASSYRNRYFLNKIERIGLRATWALTEHLKRGSFLPGYYELRFAAEEKLTPLKISLKNGEELILEGRIDRVDLLPAENGVYLKVIDYKTGRKKFSLDEAYHGLELQLLIYLSVLLNGGRDLLKMGLPPELTKEMISGLESEQRNDLLQPAGILYFRIDDPLIDGEKSGDDIEKEILKQLQLDGLIINEPEIIKAFDNQLDQGYSPVVPVRLKKDGKPAARSAVIERENFYSLLDHAREKVMNAGEEIVQGKIRIEPFRLSNGRTACDYCKYQDICQFDSTITGNGYRELEKLSNKEVVKRLQQRGETDELD